MASRDQGWASETKVEKRKQLVVFKKLSGAPKGPGREEQPPPKGLGIQVGPGAGDQRG